MFDPTRDVPLQTLMSVLAQPYMTVLRVITKNVQTHWALTCASVSQAFKRLPKTCARVLKMNIVCCSMSHPSIDSYQQMWMNVSKGASTMQTVPSSATIQMDPINVTVNMDML